MAEHEHEAMKTPGVCPRCEGVADRDSADVGVGIIYGPWGCTEGCGWSESEEYDTMFKGGVQEDGSYLDPLGGLYPADSPIAKTLREKDGKSN